MGVFSYVGRTAREAVCGFFGILFAVLALGCAAFAAWVLIKIFFITMWLALQAVLLMFGCAITAVLASALFGLSKPTPKVKKVEVLPPETNVVPMRRVDGTMEVWEKGTRV
jgi:hypothetical protein